MNRYLILAAALALAACQPAAENDTSPVQQPEALAAVMATGLSKVRLHGPRYVCAADSFDAVGSENFHSGHHDHYHGRPARGQSGLFFTARADVTANHIGREVRGVVCFGDGKVARVKVFPEPAR